MYCFHPPANFFTNKILKEHNNNNNNFHFCYRAILSLFTLKYQLIAHYFNSLYKCTR